MANTTASFMLLLGLATTFINCAHASTFLMANPHAKEEFVSEAEVQKSLLAEIDGAFGEGSASSRVKQMEASLAPVFKALPKNEHGYLGHATVRYVLHRLFVQRHGWIINGLDAAGEHRNTTSGAGVLKEHVPAYIQDLIEARLGGRGFGLHELGVLAATMEHLIHTETVKNLAEVFDLHKRDMASIMTEQEVDNLLDTYMVLYILGNDAIGKTAAEVKALRDAMPKIYMGWNDVQVFVRKMRKEIQETDASPEQMASGQFDFALVARIADRIGEHFGTFQAVDCKDIKANLVKMELPGTGRVPLHEFYKPALNGHWQFSESAEYLRQNGVLDETNPENPKVIIPNFIVSHSNCIGSSSFYAVCCMDECEGLLGHLEQEIAAPEAPADMIAKIVSDLPSSSVTAPRQLSRALLDRLDAIAAEHGSTVPLHGRLFAQWMHHAFPRECPYPHLAGTTNPITPDEWFKTNEKDSSATKEEMKVYIEKAKALQEQGRIDNIHSDALPWAHEEELLVTRTAEASPSSSGTGFFSTLRNMAMFAAMASVAYGLVQTSRPGSKALVGASTMEKYLV